MLAFVVIMQWTWQGPNQYGPFLFCGGPQLKVISTATDQIFETNLTVQEHITSYSKFMFNRSGQLIERIYFTHVNKRMIQFRHRTRVQKFDAYRILDGKIVVQYDLVAIDCSLQKLGNFNWYHGTIKI